MAEGVKSAERVLDVLELLADRPQGLTFNEIREALGLPKSSAYALLQTMTARRFLWFDPSTRCYAVGLRTWQTGQSYSALSDLQQAALPHLRAAREALDETVQLAVLDGTDNVYVGTVDSEQKLALASRVGARLPAYATGLGKALLSGLDDDEVRRRFTGVAFHRFTPATIGDVDRLVAELAGVRRRGYASDRGEYTAGVSCVAVPVHDAAGGVCAAMSVSVPQVRMTPALRRTALSVLTDQTARLSETLGGPAPGGRRPAGRD